MTVFRKFLLLFTTAMTLQVSNAQAALISPDTAAGGSGAVGTNRPVPGTALLVLIALLSLIRPEKLKNHLCSQKDIQL